MARGSKRLGLQPDKIAEVVEALDEAQTALIEVCKAYPINFDPEVPYGAAYKALEDITEVKVALTGERDVLG